MDLCFFSLTLYEGWLTIVPPMCVMLESRVSLGHTLPETQDPVRPAHCRLSSSCNLQPVELLLKMCRWVLNPFMFLSPSKDIRSEEDVFRLQVLKFWRWSLPTPSLGYTQSGIRLLCGQQFKTKPKSASVSPLHFAPHLLSAGLLFPGLSRASVLRSCSSARYQQRCHLQFKAPTTTYQALSDSLF